MSLSLSENRPYFSGTCSRSCGHLPEPKDDSGECDDGEVVSGGFLEARRDTSELFELAEAAFDEVSPGVEVLVDGMLQRAGRIVADDGKRATVGAGHLSFRRGRAMRRRRPGVSGGARETRP